MRRLTVPLLAAAALAACADDRLPLDPTTPAAGERPQLAVVNYGVTPIGTPMSAGWAINDLGQVLVARVGGPSGPYIWTNGGVQPLTSDAPGWRPVVYGMNAHGAVVGSLDSATGTFAAPALWRDGRVTRLAHVLDSGRTVAAAVNDAGRIIGRLSTNDTRTVGLVWSGPDDGAPTELQTLGGRSSAPGDINAEGLIIGATTSPTHQRVAVVWTSESAAPQPLRGLDGGWCEGAAASANAVNDRGEIVGTCGRGDVAHSVHWADKDAAPTDLGPEASFGTVRSLNELGQLVGHELRDRSGQAVIWYREGGTFRRFPLAYPAGSVSGAALAIDNRGRATGIAGDALGNSSAVLWNVPMRATIELAAGRLDGRGSVSVTIVGSRWFRAADVAAASLTLGNDDGNDTPVARKRGTPAAKLADVTRDGIPDLVVEFDEQEMMANGDIVAGATMVYLLGKTADGAPLRGAAAAQVAP